MRRNARMWTGFQAERVASLHARFGTLNASRALGSWKRLNCCLRNSWDTPTILGSTRSKLVQAGNTWATSHRHSHIWRCSGPQHIWIESFPARMTQCGASILEKWTHRCKHVFDGYETPSSRQIEE